VVYSACASPQEAVVARTRKRIDPDLLAQLEAAAAVKAPSLVEAVIHLQPETAGEIVPRPERTEEIVRSVLARVTRKLRVEPADFNVFPNLGSFVISASGEYLRELLDQPEVKSALANRPRDARPIPPSRRPPPIPKQRRR
jgi:hypothetical protein